MVHCCITPALSSLETLVDTYWLSLSARFSVPPRSSTFSSPAGGFDPVAQRDSPLDIWATVSFLILTAFSHGFIVYFPSNRSKNIPIQSKKPMLGLNPKPQTDQAFYLLIELT